MDIYINIIYDMRYIILDMLLCVYILSLYREGEREDFIFYSFINSKMNIL